MNLAEKKYVGRLEASHEDWKRRALALAELHEHTVAGQLFVLGQRLEQWRNLESDEKLSDEERFAAHGAALAIGLLIEELGQ